MKKVLVICIIGLFIVGCGSKRKSLDDILADGNYIIVDVRTEEEFLEGHLVGAKNIPYDKIDEKVSLDKEKPILVYCKSGNRSKIAFERLKKIGYTVYDLGSFDAISLPKE